MQVIMQSEPNWEKCPITLFSDVKLIKYWHRLEITSEGTLLKEALNVCKTGNHDWITYISNCLKGNGLTYIYIDPSTYSEDFICNLLKSKMEDPYIQMWDNKSRSSSKLSFLYGEKNKL